MTIVLGSTGLSFEAFLEFNAEIISWASNFDLTASSLRVVSEADVNDPFNS